MGKEEQTEVEREKDSDAFAGQEKKGSGVRANGCEVGRADLVQK